jgi:hypothetical protein
MSSKERRSLAPILAAAALLAAWWPATAGADELGELTPLPGTAGCVTHDGTLDGAAGICTAAPRLGGVMAVVLSPDGRFAYAHGAAGVDAIVTLARDPATGALTPIPGQGSCVSEDGSGPAGAGSCADVRNLGVSPEGNSIAITEDGTFLYAGGDTGVAVFRRDVATGRLTQLAGDDGCLSPDGTDDDGAATCTDARVVEYVHAITLSEDERFAYLNSSWSVDGNAAGVAVFSRDPDSGVLTQLPGADGCATTTGRDEDDTPCLDVRGGGYADSFSLTPDGTHAYLPYYDESSLAILDVDPVTGVLSQRPGAAGCLSADGTSEEGTTTCVDVGALGGVWNTAVSNDGRTLYVSIWDDRGLSVFRIDPQDAGLTPLAGKDHCVTETGASSEGADTCADGRGFGEQELLTLSADGRSLYATARDVGVQVLALDPGTGKATQLPGAAGCANPTGDSPEGPGTCTEVPAEGGTHQLALSSDQASGYFGSVGGSITVVSRQVPPVCTGTAGATAFATPFAIALPCRDPNGDPFTREIVGGPAHGTLAPVDQASGQVTYTPAAGFSGADGFTFRAVDAASASAPATAGVTVGAAPAAPPPPPDTVAPACARAGKGAISRRKLTVAFRCAEAAALKAKLTLPRKVAKRLKLGTARKVTIAAGSAQAAADARTKVTLKMKRKARKRIRALGPARLRALRPTLTIRATDLAGNTAKRSAKVRLKR